GGACRRGPCRRPPVAPQPALSPTVANRCDDRGGGGGWPSGGHRDRPVPAAVERGAALFDCGRAGDEWARGGLDVARGGRTGGAAPRLRRGPARGPSVEPPPPL